MLHSLLLLGCSTPDATDAPRRRRSRHEKHSLLQMGVVGAPRARFLLVDVDVQFERKCQTETRLKNPLDFGKSESFFFSTDDDLRSR